MRRLPKRGLMCLLAIGLLAGCGSSGPSAQEKHEAKMRRERTAHRKAQAVARARGQECEQQLGGFLEALEELNARLEIGLSYDQYTQELGTVQVAYNRIPIHALDPRCLSHVGVPSEKAFNEYVAASQAWDECIESLSCEDSISPEVQSEWSKAAEKLETAAGLGLTEVGVPQAADFIAAERSLDGSEGGAEGQLPEGRNQAP